MQDYVRESVALAKRKRQLYCKIFNTAAPELTRLKVIFFTTRQSFVEYIKRNNLYQTLLQKIIKDYSSIRALGSTILSNSVDYFMQSRKH